MYEDLSDEEILATVRPRKPELDPLRERSSRFSSFFQSQVDPYLKFIRWENETLDKDMKLFWITAHKHEKTHLSGSLQRILEWAKDKNLHPRQVIKVLLK